ncbi:MAG: polysaccharide biosynthesis/export family protein [Deltaproteobacteria bacterium]|nr:polysaccharide biosynthesis/export family protein [Deltaproteobacteria bacterium]
MTSQQGEPVDAGYKLGPEDQLRISVWDNKELTLDLVVRPDGKISMPLIQDVVAEGLTAVQLASEIKKKLSSFIVNPEVSVIVLQVNAPKYFLMGYITRPGTYPLRGEISVLQALALAGGFTQFASPRSIKLIRNENGRQEIRKINYYNLIDDGGRGNYLLKPGDTIVVP